MYYEYLLNITLFLKNPLYQAQYPDMYICIYKTKLCPNLSRYLLRFDLQANSPKKRSGNPEQFRKQSQTAVPICDPQNRETKFPGIPRDPANQIRFTMFY